MLCEVVMTDPQLLQALYPVIVALDASVLLTVAVPNNGVLKGRCNVVGMSGFVARMEACLRCCKWRS